MIGLHKTHAVVRPGRRAGGPQRPARPGPQGRQRHAGAARRPRYRQDRPGRPRDRAGGRLPRHPRAGIEEESELPFAGLHLLLRPALDRIDALPDVQAEALRGALGLAKAGPPDRFLVGLAVLSLLAELAADQPLLCVVDDAQWLDRASADALLFAARRLDSESIVLLLCARTGAFAAAGLPELRLKGLAAPAATELLGDSVPVSRRYRVLAEAAGNPLALLELPRVLASRAGRPAAADRPPPQRLREPVRRPPRADQDGAAGRGGRGDRRARPDPAGGGDARRIAGGPRHGPRGRPDRGERRRADLPPPADPGGRPSHGAAGAAARGPPGAGRRPGRPRPGRPARLAAGGRGGRPRRGDRRRPRTRGRPGPRARRRRRRAGLVPAGGRAQRRPGRQGQAADSRRRDRGRIGRSRPGRRPRRREPRADRRRCGAGACRAGRPGAAGAGDGGVSARGSRGRAPAAARGE